MMNKENEEFGKNTRQSWEIENRLKQFREAIYDGERAIRKERFDPKRRKKMEKGLYKLIKDMKEFEEIIWTVANKKEEQQTGENNG